MLAPAVVDEIQEMLRSGRLSQREIARRLDVSRGTVNAIARGKRRPGPDRRVNGSHQVLPPAGREERCPGCGGMVRMPCLMCRVRAIRERQRQCPPGARRAERHLGASSRNCET